MNLTDDMKAQAAKKVQEALDAGLGLPEYVDVTDARGCIWRLQGLHLTAVHYAPEKSDVMEISEMKLTYEFFSYPISEPLKIADVPDGYYWEALKRLTSQE